MFLLDSCILELLRRPANDPDRRRIATWLASREEAELFVCVISMAEKAFGAADHRREIERLPKGQASSVVKRTSHLQNIEKIESQMTEMEAIWGGRMLLLNVPAAKKWGELRITKATRTSLDTAIAAIALANNCRIVTANESDFRWNGLTVVNPLKPFDKGTGLNN